MSGGALGGGRGAASGIAVAPGRPTAGGVGHGCVGGTEG